MELKSVKRYYFDHNATTPVSREAIQEMLPCMAEVYGNASSIHHYGQAAKHALETARKRTAMLLHCDPRDLVITSGGTEADNLALLGAARAAGAGPRHIVTTAIEHPAVLSACRQLEREGVDVTYVEPDRAGVVPAEAVRAALRSHTVLVSVMHANNETGALQPIAEIAQVAHDAGALFHSDGVQAAGRIPVDVRALHVDLYSISG
ncbi:MAG: aminotransferase class V-fold PLP-dependent enzyme, partial [Verrucomicrobia subdivision 3 bacterium]|nr:aminotransferase class V-fold PLP-dependent enzyme [Limisphaerales bacterium]